MNPIYKCVECDIIFRNLSAKANHVRWYHTDNSAYKKLASDIAVKLNEKIHGVYIYDTTNCARCQKLIDIKYRENKKKDKYFCSRGCANARTHSKETREKISKASKNLWACGHYNSTAALSHLKLPRIFSSKREREIVKFFKEVHANDNWISGGQIHIEGVQLSRDMYSDKLRICFEYDGDWHFVDINGQLARKQYKDFLLEKWCVDNNYRLIRIDANEKLSFEEIEQLIYTNSDPIIKIGSRYNIF